MRPFLLLIAVILLPQGAFAADAAKPASEKSVAELEGLVASHPEELAWVHGLRAKAQSNDREALAALERSFDKVSKPNTKREVAKVLLSLGKGNERYWAAVEGPARARIESDMPDILAYDSTGHIVRGKFGERFVAWCKSKGVAPESLTKDALYAALRDIRVLTESKDKRAIPLLMKGLESKNPVVAMASAEGLAKYQHRPAINAIISACARFPSDSASSIAQYLIFFNDDTAQAAAAKYVKSKGILDMRRKQAAQYGADGILEKF